MKIKTYEDGSARLLWDWRDIALTTANFETLRAFFQAERDEQLGRWRDPENPNIVVYPIPAMNDQGDGYGRAVWVLDEAEMVSRTVLDDRHSHSSASHYFAAHPEPKPRPWEEAKPGEVWVLTRWGTAEPFLVTGSEFITADLAVIVDLDDDSITAGRRIWPEGEDK